MTAADSKMIRELRFPLAVLVVFIHAEPAIDGWSINNMTSGHLGSNIAGVIMLSISHIFAQIAVPLFFFISGYLFFVHLEQWDRKVWKRKIRSRVKSLLIPFLFWVTLFCVVHIVRHILPLYGDKAGFAYGVRNWLKDNGGFLNLYWAASHWIAGYDNILGQKMIMSGPFPFHLWFIRDLICNVILSPLYYLLFHTDNNRIAIRSVIFGCILLLLFLLQVQTGVPGFDIVSIFFFGIGAFFSLNNFSLLFSYKYKRVIAIVALLLFLVLIPMDGPRTQFGSILYPFWIIFGGLMAMNVVASLSKNGKEFHLIGELSHSSFFLYVIHPFLLGVLGNILHRESLFTIEFADKHPLAVLSLFLGVVFSVIVIGVAIYKLMEKISSRFTHSICGR